ncbi:YcxB family protein [Pseudomonas sp. CGJS7]|uniref:YcxB family protein n=1 Tax=Pseudomonas sp. CGJS7 TaxID=3109348 RepID=UPI00300BB8E2
MSESQTKHRVVYTEAMAKDAVRAFAWKRAVVAEKGLWAVEALLLALVVFQVWQGERAWWIGALGMVVLLPPLLFGTVWFVHHRNTVGRFRKMAKPEALIAFEQDGLAIESDLGSGRIPWSSLTEVWERPGYWMLFTAPAQFFTLPVADLSEPDLTLLRERLRAGRAATDP